MTGLSGSILRPSAAMGNPGPSSLGLPGAQVGDGSTFQARNVDFAFIRTHLSLGFRPAIQNRKRAEGRGVLDAPAGTKPPAVQPNPLPNPLQL